MVQTRKHRVLIDSFSSSAWRPLIGPLYDWPLAVLDATSVDSHRDLVASDNVCISASSLGDLQRLLSPGPSVVLFEPAQATRDPSIQEFRFQIHRRHNSRSTSLPFADTTTFTLTISTWQSARTLLSSCLTALRTPHLGKGVECVSLVLFPRGSADKVPQEVCCIPALRHPYLVTSWKVSSGQWTNG